MDFQNYTIQVESYKVKQTFKDNVQEGLQKDYFEDGKVKYELPYKNGKPEGTAKEFYPNGKLFVEATYSVDRKSVV